MCCFVSDVESSVTYFNQASARISALRQQAEISYGNKLQSCNMHILTHIPAFAKEHDPLDHWSAFFYENYNGILKRHMKCTRNTFQHAVNSMSVIRDAFASTHGRPLYFSAHCPDNCCITESGHVVMINSVRHGHGCADVSGWVLQFPSNLYTHTCIPTNLLHWELVFIK